MNHTLVIYHIFTLIDRAPTRTGNRINAIEIKREQNFKQEQEHPDSADLCQGGRVRILIQGRIQDDDEGMCPPTASISVAGCSAYSESSRAKLQAKLTVWYAKVSAALGASPRAVPNRRLWLRPRTTTRSSVPVPSWGLRPS